MLKPVLSGSFLVLCLCAAARGQKPLPPGNGKEIIEKACTSCHPVTMITSTGHTPADWKLVVSRMIAAGAPVAKNQVGVVTDYLAKNFPENRDAPRTGAVY